MTARLTRLAASAAILALAGVAVGCSEQTSTAPDQPADSTAPEPVEMSCETIIPESFAAELREIGWDVREEPFRIGQHEIDGGIQCVWGDYTSGTDIAQMYGWAPLEDDRAVELQQYLLDQGWLEESAGDVVIITENPDYALYVSDDGYGMTYAFHDGWVALADTKAGLDLVVWRG